MNAQHEPAYWPRIARDWRHVRPPLRPAAQDVEFCLSAVREWAGAGRAPRVLLLGVTPELYHLPWPAGTDILAADRSQSMIDCVWPGPREAALCSDWRTLALADGSRDIALCDGGLHLLKYPEEQRQLAMLLNRVLSDGGLCILRLYVPPASRESPGAVLSDLLQARIPNMSNLKLRLGMSLQETASEGVELAAVWRALKDAAPDLARLASDVGWPLEETLAINAYRDSGDRYCFVSVHEATDLFCTSPGGFDLRQVCVPTYELGAQCPTLVLRKRPVARAPSELPGDRM